MNQIESSTRIGPDQAVQQLQQIVVQIDAFLTDWVERMDQKSQQLTAATSPSEKLAAQMEMFQRRQSQWELQRRAQQAELESQAKLLSEAWLRLENEQRTLRLAVKPSAFPSGQSDARANHPMVGEPNAAEFLLNESGTTQCDPGPPARPEPTAANAQSVAPITSQTPSTATPLPVPRSTLPRETAIRQFEQMKDTIGSARVSSS